MIVRQIITKLWYLDLCSMETGLSYNLTKWTRLATNTCRLPDKDTPDSLKAVLQVTNRTKTCNAALEMFKDLDHEVDSAIKAPRNRNLDENSAELKPPQSVPLSNVLVTVNRPDQSQLPDLSGNPHINCSKTENLTALQIARSTYKIIFVPCDHRRTTHENSLFDLTHFPFFLRRWKESYAKRAKD